MLSRYIVCMFSDQLLLKYIMGDPISVLIWGVMLYVAMSNYSYHPSLGLNKFPGGNMYKLFYKSQIALQYFTTLQLARDIYNLTFYK